MKKTLVLIVAAITLLITGCTKNITTTSIAGTWTLVGIGPKSNGDAAAAASATVLDIKNGGSWSVSASANSNGESLENSDAAAITGKWEYDSATKTLTLKEVDGGIGFYNMTVKVTKLTATAMVWSHNSYGTFSWKR